MIVRKVMSSVSTAFKVHYNQKLGGGAFGHLGGGRTMAFGGIDAPGAGFKRADRYTFVTGRCRLGDSTHLFFQPVFQGQLLELDSDLIKSVEEIDVS